MLVLGSVSIWFSRFYYWRFFPPPWHTFLSSWVADTVKLQGGSFIVCQGQTFPPSHAQPRRTLRCWHVRRYIPSLFSLAYAPWCSLFYVVYLRFFHHVHHWIELTHVQRVSNNFYIVYHIFFDYAIYCFRGPDFNLYIKEYFLSNKIQQYTNCTTRRQLQPSSSTGPAPKSWRQDGKPEKKIITSQIGTTY